MAKLLLSLLLVSFVVYGQCCGPNEQACGSACYNPSQYYCSNGTLLCPTGWEICVGVCFNPALYDCVDIGTVDPETGEPISGLCPEGYEGCAGQCFDPNSYTCFNFYDGPLCVNGLQNCNGQCYDTTIYDCIITTSSLYGTLCPTGMQVCNGSCAPGSEYCIENTTPQGCCYDSYCDQTCPTGTSCCLSIQQRLDHLAGWCYDPTVSTCAACPNLNPTYPNSEVCPISTPTCCNGCTNEQCCHAPNSLAVIFDCPTNTTCCGIYTPSTNLCCPQGTTCYGDEEGGSAYCA